MVEFPLPEALTFDDVLIVPGASSTLPGQVDTRTRLTREIPLNLPFVSAAMDTVTESGLAIAMAQEGGIGIIHKNLSIGRTGRGGRQGQAIRVRDDRRSDHDDSGQEDLRSVCC